MWPPWTSGPVLTDAVSQQSMSVAARYLFRQAGAGAATVYSGVCHHDPDRLHPGQLAAGGVAPRPHPVSTALRCDHSSQTTCSCWTCCRSSSPLAPPRHGGIFHCVRPAGAAMPAGGQQEAASTKLVSPAQPQVLVSAAVSVQT